MSTFTFSLRNYQSELIQNVRESYASGSNAPILQCATGSGKTVMASYIMAKAAERGKRTVFLVHRLELIRQTSATLTGAGVAHGIIHPKYRKTDHHLQVASVQTMSRRLANYPNFDFLVIDESHHAAANTWKKVIDAYPDAHLLGLTATPCRLDGKGLGVNCGGFFDDLICGPSMAELISLNFLARPKIFASPHHIQVEDIGVRAGDFRRDEAGALMSSNVSVGDCVEQYIKHMDGKRAIAFCVTVDHAQIVCARFNARGIPATHVDGGMTSEARDAAINGFANGQYKIITSCELISEGFDVPACDGCLLLRPTMSESLYLQQIGRALRPSPGKDYAIILDHVGNVTRHGMPDAIREWSLDGRERNTLSAISCPRCYAVLPSGTAQCPECGHVFETESEGRDRKRSLTNVDGELVELTQEIIEQQRMHRRNEIRQARTREDLLRVARERGYNPRWVDHVLRSRGMAR